MNWQVFITSALCGAAFLAQATNTHQYPLPLMYLSDKDTGEKIEGVPSSGTERKLLEHFLNGEECEVIVNRPAGVWRKPDCVEPQPEPEPIPVEPEPIDPDPVEPAPIPDEPAAYKLHRPVETLPFPIVYSWSEQPSGDAVVKGIELPSAAKSSYASLPETGRFVSNIQEANLVLKDIDGSERTLVDCVNDDSVICAALDGKTSPDGTMIAYWKLYGTRINPNKWTLQGDIPGINTMTGSMESTICIYRIQEDRRQCWEREAGRIDKDPEWINNERIVFVSNREKVHPIHLVKKDPYSYWALQNHTANIDGSDVKNIGQHQDVALHPYVLRNGNMITAVWKVDGELGYNRGDGIQETLQNAFWMEESDQHGGNQVIAFGAHGAQVANADRPTTTNSILSPHFYGELAAPQGECGERITAIYYRNNHVGGMGQNWLLECLPMGVEGSGDSLLPTVWVVNQYGQEEDNPSNRVYADGGHGGKMSYPVGIPGGQVMVTYGIGNCFATNLTKMTTEFMRGYPGCDTAIMMTTKLPSEGPQDLVTLINDPNRMEFAAEAVLPYIATYGQLMPTQQEHEINLNADGNERCTLEVIDVRVSKMFGPGHPHPCTKKSSCIDPGRQSSELVKVAIYHSPMNLISQRAAERSGTVFEEGHDKNLLGYATPEADGSMRIDVPCETPIEIRGVDADGVEFMREQTKQSLRRGEARRCIGCHGGHTENEYYEAIGESTLKEVFATRDAAQKPPQQLSID